MEKIMRNNIFIGIKYLHIDEIIKFAETVNHNENDSELFQV